MSGHDPRLEEIDCATARGDFSLVVDRECDDACRSRLEHHLAGCPSCRELFLAERRLKEMLSRSCCGKAPTDLRERLRLQIRSTVVSTSTTVTTEGPGGATVVRHTRVERREIG